MNQDQTDKPSESSSDWAQPFTSKFDPSESVNEEEYRDPLWRETNYTEKGTDNLIASVKSSEDHPSNPESAWGSLCVEAHFIELVGSPFLAKACMEYGQYAIKLRTGDIIHFNSATPIAPGWLRLKTLNGIDVRIADIVWVADAPEGECPRCMT